MFRYNSARCGIFCRSSIRSCNSIFQYLSPPSMHSIFANIGISVKRFPNLFPLGGDVFWCEERFWWWKGRDINVHISKHTSPKHTHRDLEMMCHNLSKNIGKYQIWGSICHILNIILSCFNLPFFTTSRITPILLFVHDITTGARTGSHPKNSCALSCRGIRV